MRIITLCYILGRPEDAGPNLYNLLLTSATHLRRSIDKHVHYTRVFDLLVAIVCIKTLRFLCVSVIGYHIIIFFS